MPGYTPNSSIPYPTGSEPIRGNLTDNIRTDMEQLALAADAADVLARAGALEDAKTEFQPRFAFTEELAAVPGSRLVNAVLDPIPIDAPSNYIGGNVAFQQASGTPYGWGRADCTVAAAVSVSPKTGGVGERAIPVTPGMPVAAHVQLRAMSTQKLSATLFIDGHKPVGDALGVGTVLLSSGQLDIEPDATVTFQIADVIPAGSDITHIVLRWSFRRFGQTYPTVGDYAFFRRTMLTAGADVENPPVADYFDGNSANSYWLDDDDKSQSVTAKPRDNDAGAGLAHAVLVGHWSYRMGGRFLVGKVTTISIRIDHGLANFNTKLRPILEAHGIPYTIALGADTWGLPENAGVTKEMVNSWALGGLCSIASHGWGNHLDTSSPALMRKYIVDSKAKLEADIPAAAPIDIYMPHGGSGSGNYGGFKPTDSPEKYYGTYAGQLALSTYPICTGQFSGTAYRVQDGTPRVGQAYFNMDTFDDVGVMVRVNTAITDGRGIQLMIHPSFIDTAGYITTAQLQSVFDQIATLRTAGTVSTMSVAKQYLADSTTLLFQLDTDGVPYF